MRCALAVLFLLSLAVSAGAANDPYVPAELQPWKQWVMHGEEYRACPLLINRPADPTAFVCAWAEPLQLSVAARGGRFDLRVRTYARTWLALPGDAGNFPQEVTVDNRPVAVIEREGQPALSLAAGTHRISGRFSWTRRPETLALPTNLALVRLNVDGRVIDNPERQGQSLWLGERRQATEQPDSLDIQVYRRLADGIPMFLDTELRLAVAGSARELLIGPALPGDFLPVSLAAPLPARFEPDGRLRVQLRPGNWTISFRARAAAPGSQFGMGSPGAAWAQGEIWSYQADPALRVTNVTGEAPVDPGQVNVPAAWRQLPAFSLSPGQALMIEERSRGMSDQESNRLVMNRSLWLDFEGRGLTARDRISGQMRRGWRLDMQAPFMLTNASSGGEGLLVTQGAQPGLTGVELRTPGLALEATSRLELDGNRIPVSGWTEQIAQLRVSLNLPPGYMLLASTGVDRSPNAWIASWRLLDYFLVLVIAVAARRLFGNLLGAAALLALAVTYHEPGAPVWTWLNLVVALALASAVSANRFAWLASAYRNASYLLLLAFLVPFVANQVRLALFPQLETVPLVSLSGYGAIDQAAWMPEVDMAPAAAPEGMLERASEAVSTVKVTARESARGVAEYLTPRTAFESRYDANALVQSGPGLPAWRWRSVSLGWNGPVEPDQTFRLIMLSPWQTSAWRLIGAVLAAGLFYLLLRAGFDLPAQLNRLRGGTAAAVIAAIVLLPVAGTLHAETPPPQILQELKKRLTAPPECLPRCALVVSARADATPRELVIELDVHASERTALPLPGQDGAWQADSFSVDGRPGSLLYRDAAGVLWLPVEAGLHRVRLSGLMPVADSFQVPFPMRPMEMLASASGWEVSGVQDQRMATGSLEFARIKKAEPGKRASTDPLPADRFASFVRLRRLVELGLDWSVRNEVRRIAPERGAITMEIPLLPGESVTSDGVRVRDGKVIVALGAEERVFSWSSALQRAPTIELTAPADQPWVEVWQVSAGYTWRAEFAGTPQIMPEQITEAFWVPEYHPRPGESLTVTITRPEAVPGDTLALDRVSYVQQVGAQGSTLVLDLDYRSTRGQQHALRLPEGSELEAVIIDGKEQSLRLEEGRLELPIVPGTHRAQVRFRMSEGARWLQRLPATDVSAPASNVSVGFDLPQNRWVLLTHGPTLGPAVLYWPELVVFVLLAWLLGKTSMTPLRTRDWLLLGLGFSTFSWGVLALVTGWLFLMGWRARNAELYERESFNLIQLALAVISVAVLFVLLSAIPMALLGNPDMHVTGNNSSMYHLRWFTDRVQDGLPAAGVLSTPLWVYKSLILLWALWLSFALVRWLPWAWQSFRAGGLWNSRPRVRQEQGQEKPEG